jgi:hypothetical protein
MYVAYKRAILTKNDVIKQFDISADDVLPTSTRIRLIEGIIYTIIFLQIESTTACPFSDEDIVFKLPSIQLQFMNPLH